jgi:cysteinylglycine-S-conjugate dipeptidase
VSPGSRPRTRSSRTCRHGCRGGCSARERVALGDPFVGSLDGPAFESLKAALEEAFGRPMTTEGQGGSIPLCNVLADTYPDAEIFLMGVEEPKCLIHAPNESVDPSEIEHLAIAEALFLENYGGVRR